MFNNCRQYNEEGSVIYDDANVLERVLMSRVRELGPLPTQDGARHKPRVLRWAPTGRPGVGGRPVGDGGWWTVQVAD